MNQTMTSHLPYLSPLSRRIHCFSCRDFMILFTVRSDVPVASTRSCCLIAEFLAIKSKNARFSKVQSKVSNWHFGTVDLILYPCGIPLEWWEKLDLNQRRLSPTDLQSAPFDQTQAFSHIWWGLQESDLRRADLQSAALPSELRPRIIVAQSEIRTRTPFSAGI